MKWNTEAFPQWLSSLIDMDRRVWTAIFGLFIVLGASIFSWGITGENAPRVWQAFLINFLFWTGLSSGTVLFVAILNMTNAMWARPFKRLAEAPVLFLPFSLFFFVLLYFGRESYFHWIHEPVHGKEWWLDVNALFARDGIALSVLALTALVLVYCSVKSDVAAEKTGRHSATNRSSKSGYWKAQVFLSPVYGILYAAVLTLMAVDLIMALDPHWVSTLFGAYFFMSSFYTALAGLFFLLIVARRQEPFKTYIQPGHMHDLGKLLLGFCLVTGDFFYSQFLVIWYGNIPEETKYVILRIKEYPWALMAWGVLIVCFALPFVTLLNRKVKMKPMAMLVLTGAILLGMWCERVLLVAPSLRHEPGLPVGWVEIGITLGFAGLMALCLMFFLRAFPPLPISDPLFHRYLEERHSRE